MKKISLLPVLALVIAVAASAFRTSSHTADKGTTDYYWFEYNGQDPNGLIPGTFIDGPKTEAEITGALCDDSGTPLCLLGYRADQVTSTQNPQVIQNNGVFEQPEGEEALIRETED